MLYNAQFRQEDWFHRVCAALQLLVFCALAAFTSSFDLTNGILSNPDEATIFALESTHDDPDEDPFAETQRANYLAKVNGRGLSVMFAISRLLLLGQYVSGAFRKPMHLESDLLVFNLDSMVPCSWQEGCATFTNQYAMHVLVRIDSHLPRRLHRPARG